MSLLSWNTFIYNYGWEKYTNYINGWLPKFALFVPLIGYLLLFNDNITEILNFKHLAGETSVSEGLSNVNRLRLIYFALILLGLSNFLYHLSKPYIFKFGINQKDYVNTCLEIFTLHDFINIHSSIRSDEHFTQYGKYYDSEWDGFLEIARNEGEGTQQVNRTGNWESAKQSYGSLLRSMLMENFFKQNIKNRFFLTVCIILSSIGYILLSIPSLDLFIKVIGTML